MDNKTNEPAKIKVIVHIEDGMLYDVYASSPHIDIEVIDMDTEDWDARARNKEQLAKIKNKVGCNELFKF